MLHGGVLARGDVFRLGEYVPALRHLVRVRVGVGVGVGVGVRVRVRVRVTWRLYRGQSNRRRP